VNFKWFRRDKPSLRSKALDRAAEYEEAALSRELDRIDAQYDAMRIRAKIEHLRDWVNNREKP
jgi:hypothetical protein